MYIPQRFKNINATRQNDWEWQMKRLNRMEIRSTQKGLGFKEIGPKTQYGSEFSQTLCFGHREAIYQCWSAVSA